MALGFFGILTKENKRKFFAALSSGKKENAEEVLDYLKNYPRLLEKKNRVGGSIFHIAVAFGEKEFIEKLCEDKRFKALVYGLTNQGNSILHDVVQRLEDNGLLSYLVETFPWLVEVKNHEGQTPLDKAKERNRQWAIQLLEHPPEKKSTSLFERFPILFFQKEKEEVNESTELDKLSLQCDFLLQEGLKTEKQEQTNILLGAEEEKLIWKICSSFEEKTYFQVIALSQKIPPHQILLHISSLLDKFNRYQWVIANYVVKTLVLISGDIKKENGEFEEALSLFFEENRKVNKNHYEVLIKEIFVLAKQGEHDERKSEELKSPVNALIYAIDSLSKEEYINIVNIVSNDMRVITKQFYLSATLNDFTEKNTRMMVDYKKLVKQLNGYFGMEMLQCAHDHRLRMFEFFLDVGKALCSENEKKGPDLMGLAHVMGILGQDPVGRLELFNEISEEYKELYNNLRDLQMEEHGKWQREVLKEYPKTILSPNMISEDLMRAENEKVLFELEVKGKILSNVLFSKRTCEQSQEKFRTDLGGILKNAVLVPEEEIYEASYNIKPKAEKRRSQTFLVLAGLKREGGGSNSARTAEEEEKGKGKEKEEEGGNPLGARVGKTSSWQK